MYKCGRLCRVCRHRRTSVNKDFDPIEFMRCYELLLDEIASLSYPFASVEMAFGNFGLFDGLFDNDIGNIQYHTRRCSSRSANTYAPTLTHTPIAFQINYNVRF